LKQLFLIRHGITEQNKQSLFQGISDNQLSSLGLKQASLVALFLINQNIGKIYSSPLIRSVQTAQPFSDSVKIPIVIETTLKEINCGDWEGKSVEEIKHQSSKFIHWLTLGNVKAPNGESVEDITNRISLFIEKLLKESLKTDKNIAVFAHGAINRAFICKILGLPSKKAFRFEQENGCINCFTIREDFPPTVKFLNYTNHLSELKNEQL